MMRFGMITRLLGPRMLWLFLGLIILIEAIYLAEEFTTLMSFIVANGGGVWDTLILSLLKTPEIIDFTLPIAIMIALYFAILSVRDSNELMICAAAGVSWWQIPRFAGLIGIVCALISIGFAGYISPISKHWHRITAQSLQASYTLSTITPKGTYFVMTDISQLGFANDVEFCRHLTTKVGVAAIPPRAFYVNKADGAGLARFTFCKRDEALLAAAERLAQASF